MQVAMNVFAFLVLLVLIVKLISTSVTVVRVKTAIATTKSEAIFAIANLGLKGTIAK